jgi:hypothetical protein
VLPISYLFPPVSFQPPPAFLSVFTFGRRYDPKGCFSQVHGEYEEELKRRRVDAEKIEWVDVDEQLMQKLQV